MFEFDLFGDYGMLDCFVYYRVFFLVKLGEVYCCVVEVVGFVFCSYVMIVFWLVCGGVDRGVLLYLWVWVEVVFVECVVLLLIELV